MLSRNDLPGDIQPLGRLRLGRTRYGGKGRALLERTRTGEGLLATVRNDVPP